nr:MULTISPECIES: trypsin-like serine protease [unclassified Rhizobium]
MFSSAKFPFSAALVVQQKVECSGIFIGQGVFLTAAHCLCPGMPDASACAPAASQFRGEVFSPWYGTLKVAGQPIVHPEFNLAALDKVDGPERTIADLALVPVDARIPVPEIEIAGEDATVPPLALVGFGRTDVSSNTASSNPVHAGRYDNFPTVSYLPKAVDCAPAWAATQCFSYTATSFKSGKAAPCKGDSGGAILQLRKGGGITLVGLASSLIGNELACDSSSSHFFVSMNLSRFRTWLDDERKVFSSNVSSGTKPVLRARDCVDGLKQIEGTATVSVAPFGKSDVAPSVTFFVYSEGSEPSSNCSVLWQNDNVSAQIYDRAYRCSAPDAQKLSVGGQSLIHMHACKISEGEKHD